MGQCASKKTPSPQVALNEPLPPPMANAVVTGALDNGCAPSNGGGCGSVGEVAAPQHQHMMDSSVSGTKTDEDRPLSPRAANLAIVDQVSRGRDPQNADGGNSNASNSTTGSLCTKVVISASDVTIVAEGDESHSTVPEVVARPLSSRAVQFEERRASLSPRSGAVTSAAAAASLEQLPEPKMCPPVTGTGASSASRSDGAVHDSGGGGSGGGSGSGRQSSNSKRKSRLERFSRDHSDREHSDRPSSSRLSRASRAYNTKMEKEAKRTAKLDAANATAAEAAANAGGVVPYPICPDVPDGSGPALSLRQKCLAPELVARWEAEMEFTETQYAKLKELRDILVSEGLLHESYDNTPSFYRFLQARKWTVDEAVKMFRNHVVWRRQVEMDEWVPTERGPVPKFVHEFSFPEIRKVKAAYAFVHHKIAKDGKPIYFDRVGAINFGEMVKHSSVERVLSYFNWYAEATQQYRFPAASITSGKYVGKGYYVMDMKGFTPWKFNAETRAFLQATIKVASDNYPESIYKTYLVNTPFVFRGVWSVISKWIDENTVRKFSLLGGEKDYMPKLLQLLDKEDIPAFLGGSDTTCNFVEESGPWSDAMPSRAGPRLDAL